MNFFECSQKKTRVDEELPLRPSIAVGREELLDCIESSGADAFLLLPLPGVSVELEHSRLRRVEHHQEALSLAVLSGHHALLLFKYFEGLRVSFRESNQSQVKVSALKRQLLPQLLDDLRERHRSAGILVIVSEKLLESGQIFLVDWLSRLDFRVFGFVGFVARVVPQFE